MYVQSVLEHLKITIQYNYLHVLHVISSEQ